MLRDLAETLTRVLVQIALNQADPAERRAMLEIMRDDGWLSDVEIATLGLGRAA